MSDIPDPLFPATPLVVGTTRASQIPKLDPRSTSLLRPLG